MRFAEYPLEIFNPLTIMIFTFVIQIGFISYYPAQIFVGQGIWITAAYLTPLVALVMLAISIAFWKFGLKNYTSTGS